MMTLARQNNYYILFQYHKLICFTSDRMNNQRKWDTYAV